MSYDIIYLLNTKFKFQELIYISHSMSRQALQFIFKVLLPSDLEEKQVLDVGSRFGAVLYGVSSKSLKIY